MSRPEVNKVLQNLMVFSKPFQEAVTFFSKCLKGLFLYQTQILLALYKYRMQRQSLLLPGKALVILMGISLY